MAADVHFVVDILKGQSRPAACFFLPHFLPSFLPPFFFSFFFFFFVFFSVSFFAFFLFRVFLLSEECDFVILLQTTVGASGQGHWPIGSETENVTNADLTQN